MSRSLMTTGSMLLLLTAALSLSGALGWLPEKTADHWSMLSWKAGFVLLAAGVVGRVLSPVKRAMRGERCETCGRPTLAGHTYCSDHLQEAVNAARDRASRRDRLRPAD